MSTGRVKFTSPPYFTLYFTPYFTFRYAEVPETTAYAQDTNNFGDAAKARTEAGATPPWDAPCVPGLCEVAPASGRDLLARWWFGRVPIHKKNNEAKEKRKNGLHQETT